MARRRAAPRVARRLGARAGGRQRECAGARARPGVDAGARARLARRVVVRAHRGDLAARHRQPGAAALLAGARFDGPPRCSDAASRQGGELVRCIVERAAAQSEALELLLVVALADAMLSPAFVDELPRIVPTVLEGQRDNDPERALMARHTAALLVQYGMSDAHVDALLGTLRTLVVTSVVAVALRRAADAAAARVSQPLCTAAHRRVGARDWARGTARPAHRGARKRQRPDRLGAARPGAVARRRAASRRISSHRRARKTPLGSTPVCSSEPYNVPTWLLDVAQALARPSSASSRVCRDAATPCRVRVLPHARPRHRGARRDEAELLAANERLVRVAAQLRKLSATQTHYA
jgi:hypothetical protein